MPQSAPLQWTHFYLLTCVVLITIFAELWYFGAAPNFSFFFYGVYQFSWWGLSLTLTNAENFTTSDFTCLFCFSRRVVFFINSGIFFILTRSFLLLTAFYTFFVRKFLGCAEILKALSKLGFIGRLRAYLFPFFMVAIAPFSLESSGSIPVHRVGYYSEGHLEGVRGPIKMVVEQYAIPEPSSVDPNAVVAITGPKYSFPYIKDGVIEWTGAVNEHVVDCPSIRSVDVIPFNIWDLYDISLSDLGYYLDKHYGVGRFFPAEDNFLNPYCVDLDQFVTGIPDLNPLDHVNCFWHMCLPLFWG